MKVVLLRTLRSHICVMTRPNFLGHCLSESCYKSDMESVNRLLEKKVKTELNQVLTIALLEMCRRPNTEFRISVNERLNRKTSCFLNITKHSCTTDFMTMQKIVILFANLSIRFSQASVSHDLSEYVDQDF